MICIKILGYRQQDECDIQQMCKDLKYKIIS